MKYAIIAAGEGSRLAAEGVPVFKPLVKINGEPLIDRLIRIFIENGGTEIVVICNDRWPEVRKHLAELKKRVTKENNVIMHLVVKNTPSSMHSFYELSRYLIDEPFCLTTVDTIFRESEFAAYINEFKKNIMFGACDGLMAVTDYVDDEKPLYVDVNTENEITGFLDVCDSCKYISGGIYCLTPDVMETLNHCMAAGKSRMRNFQRALVADGRELKAYPFSKILDVDHASDIDKAELFLKGT